MCIRPNDLALDVVDDHPGTPLQRGNLTLIRDQRPKEGQIVAAQLEGRVVYRPHASGAPGSVIGVLVGSQEWFDPAMMPG